MTTRLMTIIRRTLTLTFFSTAFIFAAFSTYALNEIPDEDLQMEQGSTALSYYHFLEGSLAALDNNSKAALTEFELASKYFPQSTYLQLKRAEEHLDLGEVKEAKVLLNKIALKENKNPEFHLLRARQFSQENDFQGGLQSLELATQYFLEEKLFSKARETMLTRVALLADHKKYTEAIQTLDKYLKKQKDDEVAFYFLGKIHSIFQNHAKARKAYEQALELRPSFTAASKALGLQQELDGMLKPALQTYLKALRFNSSDDELLQKLINLSLIQDDYVGALDYLRQYLLVRPDDTSSMMRAGLIHYKLKQYDEAQNVFEELLKAEGPTQDRVLFYLGTLSEERTHLEKAVSYYDKIQASSEYYVEARVQMAQILTEKLKNPVEAIRVLSAASQSKSDSADLVLALASQHEKAKQMPEAIRVLSKATEQFKESEKVYFMLGTYLDRAGDFEAGIRQMREVLRINPNNAHAINHIGYAYAEHKIHLDEAEGLLKKAVQLAPDNGFILDSLGWAYFQREDYKKAAKLLERANQMSPKQEVILEHLADCYQKMGQKEKALAAYRAVVKLSDERKQKQNAEFQTAANESTPTKTGATPTAAVASAYDDSDNAEEREAVAARVRSKLASLSAAAANPTSSSNNGN